MHMYLIVRVRVCVRSACTCIFMSVYVLVRMYMWTWCTGARTSCSTIHTYNACKLPGTWGEKRRQFHVAHWLELARLVDNVVVPQESESWPQIMCMYVYLCINWSILYDSVASHYLYAIVYVHACVFVYIWVHTVWFSRTSLLFRARDVISELSESSFATTMSLYTHFVAPPNIFCVSCRWMLIDSISHEYRKALHIEWDVSCHDEKTQNVDTRLGMS